MLVAPDWIPKPRRGPVIALVMLGMLTAAGSAQNPATSAAYTFVPVPHGMQLKTPNGRVVFDYLTTKPEDMALTSPSVALINTNRACGNVRSGTCQATPRSRSEK